MATVQITLPDELLNEVQEAGLLAPDAVEEVFREQLKKKRVDAFFATLERMHAIPDSAPMTPEEVAERIRAMRAERRAGAASCA